MSSVFSEPHNRTSVSPQKGKPRMMNLESLEAKMANIEVSLSSTVLSTSRRRKGISLGGARSTTNIEISPQKEQITAFQERDAVINNLRLQLGLEKLPRPTGTPLNAAELPAAENELHNLRIEADNKRIAIRNLKTAIDNLDISDNIDIRIKQAELEYALGREELHLLSLVEEIRALQCRIEKSLKTEGISNQSLYSQLTNGINMLLCPVIAKSGRFGITIKDGECGIYVDWTLDGESLLRDDRIIECNGKMIDSQSKDEVEKIICSISKCELVVIRKKNFQHNHQMLLQSQEDNQRLQHRISYLEDQVKDLQKSTKDIITIPVQNQIKKQAAKQNIVSTDHVTSIKITPSNISDDKPQLFQRGNFVATIIGGKAIHATSYASPKHSDISNSKKNATFSSKSAIKGSAGYPRSDSEHDLYYQRSADHSQQYIGLKNKMLTGPSSISIRNHNSSSQSFLKHREKNRDFSKENYRIQRSSDRHNSQPDLLFIDKLDSKNKPNYSGADRLKKGVIVSDIHSTNRLDFEEEMSSNTSKRSTATNNKNRNFSEVDYTSEPVATPLSNSSRLRSRPTPPKKPLRLSLQRTQSLQVIEAHAAATITELDRKRATKRTHRGNRTPDLHFTDGESNFLYK